MMQLHVGFGVFCIVTTSAVLGEDRLDVSRVLDGRFVLGMQGIRERSATKQSCEHKFGNRDRDLGRLHVTRVGEVDWEGIRSSITCRQPSFFISRKGLVDIFRDRRFKIKYV